jgi:gliding motility-associated-like protein
LTLLSPGVYSLTVTDQNGCAFESEFTITEPDKVTVDVGPNLTVQAQDSVRIDLVTNVPAGAIGTIDWGGYDGVFCPGCPSFQFIATSSATISASVSDTAGCTAFDSLRLTVIVPRIIFIPNIFSPNGDGINDFFTISGRFNLTDITMLRIFDRWGNQLFEKPDLMPGEQSQGWDGTFNDEPMQPGVYVFVAELLYEDGYSESVSGNITLVR